MNQRPKSPPGFLGLSAAFYPEHMDESLWEDNVKRIADTGFSAVRIGEFWWDKLEPEEGHYTTGWLDGLLAMLEKHGVQAILCTPTATPPAWMCEKYSDILPVDEDGRVKGFGGRRHTCPTSPRYRDICARITSFLADRYGSHPTVVAWHIDNELGHPFCYCDSCRAAFHHWLEDRYGTPENLNRRMLLNFWAQTVKRFDQVPLPPAATSPGLKLAFRRFMSRQWIDYFRVQRDAIKQAGCPQPVTTNMMAPWHGYDHVEMAEYEDVVGYDFYPVAHPYGYSFELMAFFAAFYRSLKGGQNIWLLETQTGSARSVLMMTGQVRELTLGHVALGADLVDYFRWDMPSGGAERLNRAIVHPEGQSFRFHEEIRQTAKDVSVLRPHLKGTRVPGSEIGVLFSQESWWDSLTHPPISGPFPGQAEMPSEITYPYHHLMHFKALLQLGHHPDIVQIHSDLSRYRFIVAPSLSCLDQALAEKLGAFVAAGGTLLAVGFPGAVDEDGNSSTRPPPGLLTDLLGVQIMDWGRRGSATPPLTMAPSSAGQDLPSLSIGEWMEPAQALEGTEVLASYSLPSLSSYAVLTRKQTGRGSGLFLGTLLAHEDLLVFYRWLLAGINVAEAQTYPPGVFLTKRTGAQGDILFALNTNPEAVSIQLEGLDTDLLTPHETVSSEVAIEAYGARVFLLKK